MKRIYGDRETFHGLIEFRLGMEVESKKSPVHKYLATKYMHLLDFITLQFHTNSFRQKYEPTNAPRTQDGMEARALSTYALLLRLPSDPSEEKLLSLAKGDGISGVTDRESNVTAGRREPVPEPAPRPEPP